MRAGCSALEDSQAKYFNHIFNISLKSASFILQLAKETSVSFIYKEKELKPLQEMPILQPGTLHINSAPITQT